MSAAANLGSAVLRSGCTFGTCLQRPASVARANWSRCCSRASGSVRAGSEDLVANRENLFWHGPALCGSGCVPAVLALPFKTLAAERKIFRWLHSCGRRHPSSIHLRCLLLLKTKSSTSVFSLLLCGSLHSTKAQPISSGSLNHGNRSPCRESPRKLQVPWLRSVGVGGLPRSQEVREDTCRDGTRVYARNPRRTRQSLKHRHDRLAGVGSARPAQHRIGCVECLRTVAACQPNGGEDSKNSGRLGTEFAWCALYGTPMRPACQ